ncbi:hypothetical protein GCM10027416_19380 [Okibacterium endophyticum]
MISGRLFGRRAGRRLCDGRDQGHKTGNAQDDAEDDPPEQSDGDSAREYENRSRGDQHRGSLVSRTTHDVAGSADNGMPKR